MSRLPRIAVIAVHGVADQQPGDSAGAVAGLLLQLDTDGKVMTSARQPEAMREALYARFDASTLHIPLRPLAVSQRVTRRRRRPFELFEEHEPDESAADADRAKPPSGVHDPGARTPSYVTTVLEGTRTPSSGADGPHVAVDVYELHWADLSRLGRGVAAFFTGLYGAVAH